MFSSALATSAVSCSKLVTTASSAEKAGIDREKIYVVSVMPCVGKKYEKRIDECFMYRDQNNCKRVYEEIIKLK